MKNLICSLLLLSATWAMSQNVQNYQLDTRESIIHWRGYYAFKFSEHNGTVLFRSGTLQSKDGAITSGIFVIEMDSMTNEDHQMGQGPVAHLKDPDFFDVPNNPTARLTITSVEYFANDNLHKFIGDLTIKGVTKSQEFWGTADANTNTITTRFKIDRNRWGITYNNKMRDHAIADAIEFDVKLVFNSINQ